MMKTGLNIHVEALNDKDFGQGNKLKIVEYLLENKIPHALSFSPWQEKVWKYENPELFELFKNSIRRGNTLGQQGLTHKCRYEHKLIDPWHENKCLYGRSFSFEDQLDIMKRGKDKLESLFEKPVELYIPPNHQFDENTIGAAANLGYKFLSDKAMIPIMPYKYGGILIVPERDLEEGKFDCGAVYIHYDEINKVKTSYSLALDKAVSFRDLKFENPGEYRIKLNEVLKRTYKYIRDGRKIIRKVLKHR